MKFHKSTHDTFDRDALLRWGDESPAFVIDPEPEEDDDDDRLEKVSSDSE